MRHRVAGRKFSLPSDQRSSLLKGLVRSLFINDKIVTTETRAKEVKPLAEQLITTAKRNDIHSRRMVRRFIDSNIAEFGVNPENGKTARNPHYVIPRLFEEIAPRYRNRPGGYTRITRLGARRGDGAPMVMLELVEGEAVEKPKAAESKAKAATEAPEKKKRGLLGRKKA